MKKIILFAGLSVSCAALIGVGVSFAHSGNLFGPTEPDWLEVSQQTPVIVPDVQPSRAKSVVQADTTTLSDPSLGDVSVPNATPSVSLAHSSVAPEMTEDNFAAATLDDSAPLMDPTLSAEITPTENLATIQQVSTRSVAGSDVEDLTETRVLQKSPPQNLLSPPDVANSDATAMDNVWLLGVFR